MTNLNEFVAVEMAAKNAYGAYFVDPLVPWEDAPEADKIMWRAIARAAIAAYEAALWQPIGPEHEDGQDYLLWRSDAGVFVGAYVHSFAEGDVWPDRTGDELWFTASGEDISDDMPAFARPLPAPPETGREG